MQLIKDFQGFIDSWLGSFSAVNVLIANEPPFFKALNRLLAP
jgi:hypothetical protein